MKIKIYVVGTRGIPNIQGGVETHCQELLPRLANLGYDITTIVRSPYVSKKNRINYYKNVRLKYIYSPRIKILEAIFHTFFAIIYAKVKDSGIIHIHAIGPAILTPFAKFLGLKVVFTHHGPDYDRKKWNKYAKMILKLGERCGVKFADQIIAISKVIKQLIENKYNRNDIHLIYNGVICPGLVKSNSYLNIIGVKPMKYILAVGRFVEEKGFHDLISAYKKLNISEYNLVIAGDADHETKYSRELKRSAKDNGVILTGFIAGVKLQELYSNARLFVLPSYHEGLPISLLEAISYNLDVLVSDIPANLEVKLYPSCYFKVGDQSDLYTKILNKLSINDNINYQSLLYKYNWDKIARQTAAVYDFLL